MTTQIEVISAGALTTIQDLGRPGWAHIGVPRSGAADRDSLIQANLLVGNGPSAAALETTLVGPKLRAGQDFVVALTGAPAKARIDGEEVAMHAPTELAAGRVLSVGTASSGLHTYIAVRGGITAELTLGSAATDLLTGLGPAPLAKGDVLAVGDEPDSPWSLTGAEPPDPAKQPEWSGERPLTVVLGPRADHFTEGAVERLLASAYTVTPDSNRIGLRLDGPRLERVGNVELRSEGLVPGSIQVPPAGQPILLLADHPTTGGYPVIAVLRSAELARAGQLRPGQTVRFTTG